MRIQIYFVLISDHTFRRAKLLLSRAGGADSEGEDGSAGASPSHKYVRRVPLAACQPVLLAILCLGWLLLGCTPSNSPDASQTLTLATTTSTRDSGLLDVLVPMFQEATGIKVKVVAVGSGQALELGRRGDADLLLTHAPDAEKEFVEEGFAKQRRPVMYNDFVLLGPKEDPAGIAVKESPSKESPFKDSIVQAFKKIKEAASPFVSRGDNSGTHMKERKIWQLAEVDPTGPWYIEAGAGMAAILRIASQKRAYTLTDRSTFLVHQKQLELEVLCQGDALLKNNYSVMVISPGKHPHVAHQAAQQFADFLVSPQVQKAIAQYGLKQYGQPLFFIEPQL